MEDNHDSVWVNAILENYEKQLDISLIDNNPYLHENHTIFSTRNEDKGNHLKESTHCKFITNY